MGKSRGTSVLVAKSPRNVPKTGGKMYRLKTFLELKLESTMDIDVISNTVCISC